VVEEEAWSLSVLRRVALVIVEIDIHRELKEREL
jgi:hypothetical protein